MHMDLYRRKRTIALAVLGIMIVGIGGYVVWKLRQPVYTRSYPKLVNYYLTHAISKDEARQLAKWDVVILGPEVSVNSPEALAEIKRRHPSIVLLAYFEGVSKDLEIAKNAGDDDPTRQQQMLSRDEWLLKNAQGDTLNIWPDTQLLNPTDYAVLVDGKRWKDAFPAFVASTYRDERVWDGVFIDNVLEEISWVDDVIDIDGDGTGDDAGEVDRAWREGILDMMKDLRERTGEDAIIVTNSSSIATASANGRMFENAFSDASEWAQEFEKISNAQAIFSHKPNYLFVNANTGNTGDREDQKFRFAFGTTLLTDAYFSFDHGDEWHQQLWWYSAYDFDLGAPLGAARKIRDAKDAWQREFQNGILIVNGSSDAQTVGDITIAGHDATLLHEGRKVW